MLKVKGTLRIRKDLDKREGERQGKAEGSRDKWAKRTGYNHSLEVYVV